MATDYSGRVGPDREWHTRPVPESILVIACGALAQEITALKRASGWDHLHLATMDAWLHNRPGNIPELLREKLRRYRDRYDRIFVAYADCGTGGRLDRILEQRGIEVIESDLGEYIIQLAEEPPSHIVAPAIHKNRREVADYSMEVVCRSGLSVGADPP